MNKRMLFNGVMLGLVGGGIAAKKPNVIFIYGDDVGYADVGVNGSEMIPTPNIDRLAKHGLNFVDGHCSAATCTPSRYSLLTGVYGFRDNVSILPPNAPLSISTKILTLPKLFQKAGYETAVIGKWHLGIGQEGVKTDWNGIVKPGPMEIGFDYSFLLPSTNDRVPCVLLDGHRVLNHDPLDPIYVSMNLDDVRKKGSTQYPDGLVDTDAMTYYKSAFGHNNSVIGGIGRIGYMSGGKKALWDDEQLADQFVDRATKYIEKNKDNPFFMYFAAQDVHVPRAPHPRFKGKTKLGYRGDAMVQFDWSAGQIMKALKKHGLTENTIVIFSSDNGPTYNDGYHDGYEVYRSQDEGEHGHDASGEYRGGKYQIYEGGTRIPLIISWPGTIKPGTSTAMVNQIDFLASFANMLDIDLKPTEAKDSRDMLDTFLGKSNTGLAIMPEEAGVRRAVRQGHWKYVAAHKFRKNTKWIKTGGAGETEELYDLSKDPSEQNNLAALLPEKTEELRKLWLSIKEGDGLRPSGLK